jgi:hypothetical protein
MNYKTISRNKKKRKKLLLHNHFHNSVFITLVLLLFFKYIIKMLAYEFHHFYVRCILNFKHITKSLPSLHQLLLRKLILRTDLNPIVLQTCNVQLFSFSSYIYNMFSYININIYINENILDPCLLISTQMESCCCALSLVSYTSSLFIIFINYLSNKSLSI